MAGIDDKMRELEFTARSTRPVSELRRLVNDAAEVAQGEKVILTDTANGGIKGVVRNFVRVQHAVFTVALTTDDSGATTVTFRIPDYMRTRDTVMFIPISPWSAPAYRTLREFSGYVRGRL
ncbi:MAG: hypothetical protein EPO52_12395 [Herbiconiux sp.]|uniref:hypothetical protein n=1 Tax=Herbiconiux sp. TaxID=1871186 RepID=UPI00121D3C24|nr:hypothetical protein [Herbiconiux sp.]TAJ47295.1 MAG: hypothetical protein EPO52_12395 [Herbiconiux sp.]